jgi:hypothetical protein
MPQKKYLVTLPPEERQQLAKLLSAGKRSARTLTRARTLLLADQAGGGPAWEGAATADALGCGHRTVERVRQRFVEQGLDAARAVLERILDEQTWWNVFGHFQHEVVYEARVPSGHGARWVKGVAAFIGFLEPFLKGEEP